MTSKNRRLVMEDSGFDPKSMFTDEQIIKMRNMTPTGSITVGTYKHAYIKIKDRKDVPHGIENISSRQRVILRRKTRKA